MGGHYGGLSAIAISILLAVGVAEGCGGEDEDATAGRESTATVSLSKAKFIEQANAACAKERAGLGQRIAEFERRRAGRKPLAGADMVHFVYLPTMETQIWRLEKLGAPPGQDERIFAMLDASRSAVDAIAVVPRVPSLAVAERRFAKADRLFKAYGLDACVTDAGSSAARNG